MEFLQRDAGCKRFLFLEGPAIDAIDEEIEQPLG